MIVKVHFSYVEVHGIAYKSDVKLKLSEFLFILSVNGG